MKKILSFRNLILLAALTVLTGSILLWAHSVRAQRIDSPPVFPHSNLTVQRADGEKFIFDVEVATTPPQEAYGLMFRQSLAHDSGMIFISDPDRLMAMWMKNTYIPLDMLFVRHDGTIAKIIAHAVPFDLTPLPSGEPVRAVIELHDGEAGLRNIKIGDKVLFSAFSNQP